LTLEEIIQARDNTASEFQEIVENIKLDDKKAELSDVRKVYEKPDIWSDPDKAVAVARKVQRLEEEIERVEQIENLLKDLDAALELLQEGYDEELFEHALATLKELQQRIELFRLVTLFTEPYDTNDAILMLHAGAGGVDAMDWTQMLMRMYLRWAERMGFETEIVDISRGEEAGVKSCTVFVRGSYAYGYLRAEKGVHRLVRLSPFDADHRRPVDIPASNIKRAIANILLEEGYIKGIEEIDDGKQGVLRLKLKYTANKQNVISGLKRISKPGLRVYAGKSEIPKVLGGLGIAIISTSKGIMTDKKARAEGVGGEVLAFVW